jgi:anti-sigma regulatory factor (Ser/Thr protein kinase)
MDESESEDSLYLTVGSETESVPLVLERVAQFTRRQGIWASDTLLLVVRELLMNAIVHGNESRPSRIALVRIAKRGGLYEVQVDDEGEGFDYDSLELGLPEDPHTLNGRGRGLLLVHALSERLIFERGGRRVRAIVHPDGKRPISAREGYIFAESKNGREASCTSPMGKSL